MELHEWQPIVADRSVRALKYEFRFGTANTLALRLDDGTWLVLSPGCGVPAADLDSLAKDGDVSALVAPNAFHHLGQASWRERFPNAVSYAPEGSLARLAEKSAGIPYRPLAELTAKLPPRVKLFVPAGMKSDDVLARAETSEGTVWFGGDLISNTIPSDIAFLPRMLFGLLGGGSGYRFNRVPAMFYLRDKAAWKSDVLKAVEEKPPVVMIPGHGAPVRSEVAERTRKLLA